MEEMYWASDIQTKENIHSEKKWSLIAAQQAFSRKIWPHLKIRTFKRKFRDLSDLKLFQAIYLFPSMWLIKMLNFYHTTSGLKFWEKQSNC